MTASRAELAEITIGSRICADDGHYGTVLYLGSVAGTKGEWYGVEWDDVDRGKHDGEYDGVRYFTAKPGRGSFLRPKKIQTRGGFLQQLTDRYGLQSDPNAGVITEQLYVGDGSGQFTRVEMIGAEKVNKLQSNFHSLEIVVLREALIHRLEPDVNLAQLVPNIMELNLSKNLFSSWESVADIAEHLRRLKILNVSENRLKCQDSPEKLASDFAGLRSLFLNRMELDFSTILSWSVMWAGIEELHICFNGITRLSNPGLALTNLRLLNLEGNELHSWDKIMILQNLKNLANLILNDTGLATINLENLEQGGFQSLTEISLCGNRISDWSSINELNRLELKDVKLNGNPLMASEQWETVRDLVIAKIRNLKLMNRTEVTTEERQGAELAYLRKFGPEWLKAGGNQDPVRNKPNSNFLEMHPRFQELADKYGAPETSEMYRAPQGLKENFIQIHLKGPEKTITKNVPFTMSVEKLKIMAHKLMKADLLTLTLIDIGQGQGEKACGNNGIELDNNLRDLNFYSVVSGDVIEVKWR